MDLIPLYKQLAEDIIGKIKSGTIQENTKLPSERLLAQKYNVSRFTVRSAIQYLEKQQIVHTIHGSGTFVLAKAWTINLNHLYSFDEELATQDKTLTTDILSNDLIVPDAIIVKKMHLGSEEKTHKVIALRSVENMPVMLQTHHISHNRIPRIPTKHLTSMPLYDYFESFYHVTISTVQEKIQFYLPTKNEYEFLGIAESIPCLKIERLAYDQQKLVEYTSSIIRADKYVYAITLTKD